MGTLAKVDGNLRFKSRETFHSVEKAVVNIRVHAPADPAEGIPDFENGGLSIMPPSYTELSGGTLVYERGAVSPEYRHWRTRLRNAVDVYKSLKRAADELYTYEFKRFRIKAKERCTYFRSYGTYTQRRETLRVVRRIAGHRWKMVTYYEPKWVLFIARNAGFKPRDWSHFIQLDRVGRRFKKRIFVKKTKRVRRLVWTTEFRTVLSPWDTYEVPIKDLNGNTGRWVLNRPLYKAIVSAWRLKNPKYGYYLRMGVVDAHLRLKKILSERPARVVQSFKRMEGTRHGSFVMPDRPAALLTESSGFVRGIGEVTSHSWEHIAKIGDAVRASSETQYAALFPTVLGYTLQADGQPYRQRSVDFKSLEISAQPDVSRPVDVAVTRVAHVPSVETSRDVELSLDSEAARLENLDFRSSDEWVWTRALIELKDVPGTLRVGRSFLDWLHLNRKAVAQLRRSSRVVRHLHNLGVVVMTSLKFAAGVYLAYKWGIMPTLEDIATVVGSTARYVFAVRRGLTRLIYATRLSNEAKLTLIRKLPVGLKHWPTPSSVVEVDGVTPADLQLPTDPRTARYYLRPNMVEGYNFTGIPIFEQDGSIDWSALGHSGRMSVFSGSQSTDPLGSVPHIRYLAEWGSDPSYKELTDLRVSALLDGILPPLALYQKWARSRVFAEFFMDDLRRATKVEGAADILINQMAAYETAFEVTPFSWLTGWLTDVYRVTRDIQNLWSTYHDALYAPTTDSLWGFVGAEVFAAIPEVHYLHSRALRMDPRSIGRTDVAYYDHVGGEVKHVTGTIDYATEMWLIDSLVPVLASSHVAFQATGARWFKRAPLVRSLEHLTVNIRAKLNGDKVAALAAVLLGFLPRRVTRVLR